MYGMFTLRFEMAYWSRNEIATVLESVAARVRGGASEGIIALPGGRAGSFAITAPGAEHGGR